MDRPQFCSLYPLGAERQGWTGEVPCTGGCNKCGAGRSDSVRAACVSTAFARTSTKPWWSNRPASSTTSRRSSTATSPCKPAVLTPARIRANQAPTTPSVRSIRHASHRGGGSTFSKLKNPHSWLFF